MAGLSLEIALCLLASDISRTHLLLSIPLPPCPSQSLLRDYTEVEAADASPLLEIPQWSHHLDHSNLDLCSEDHIPSFGSVALASGDFVSQ